MAVANTLAYYNKVKITAVKSFIAQAKVSYQGLRITAIESLVTGSLLTESLPKKL